MAAAATVPGARAVFGREYDRALWIAAIDPQPGEGTVAPKGGWIVESTRRADGVLLVRARR
jgi:hypothetical protein